MRWTTLLAANLLSTATALGGGARGTVKTKEEGVVEVERAFTRGIVKADWR